ncbi:MAG: heavy-metal-associated domain-containing protein [Catalinimonas sp.]
MYKIILSLFLLVPAVASAQTEEMHIKTSAVCGMCKYNIERSLAFEKGVKTADLDVETQMLTVTYLPKKTDPDRIRRAVTGVGYDADSLPAQPRAYERLDACCKKDQPVHFDKKQ